MVSKFDSTFDAIFRVGGHKWRNATLLISDDEVVVLDAKAAKQRVARLNTVNLPSSTHTHTHTHKLVSTSQITTKK